MLDEFLAYAQVRVRSGGRTTVMDPDAQLVVAQAENAIDELTAIAQRNVGNLIAYAERGEVPPAHERLKYKFQMATASERCRALGERILQAAGASGDRDAAPLRADAGRPHRGAATHHQPIRNARAPLGRASVRRNITPGSHAVAATENDRDRNICSATHDVGGVLLERPFKIRRIGHFGVNALRMEECVRFYTEELGFRISDLLDFSQRTKPELIAGLGDPNGHFLHHGTDHHSFVIFNKRVHEAGGRGIPGSEVVMNQISWQVGSLAEVVNGNNWLVNEGLDMERGGRDMPGSNWNTYFLDPDGQTNELFLRDGADRLGRAQQADRDVGRAAFSRTAGVTANLRRRRGSAIRCAKAGDLDSGLACRDALPGAGYDVEGIMLPRPFKIIRVGPIGLFVNDIDATARFYTSVLGGCASPKKPSGRVAAASSCGQIRSTTRSRCTRSSCARRWASVPTRRR